MCYILFMNYAFSQDIRAIRSLLALSQSEFSRNLGIAPLSLKRWEKGDFVPNSLSQEKLYEFAYSNRSHPLRLNALKSEFRYEDRGNDVLLFHGARSEVSSPIDTRHSHFPSDFGAGFYAGESLLQAGSWVALDPASSVYLLYFTPEVSLRFHCFEVGVEWMIAVAFYRGKLLAYKNSFRLRKILSEIEECDYLIAPIADNQMYQTIADFIAGYLTTEQCLHALSASPLGYQYVFRKDDLCAKLILTDRLYLCESERKDYLDFAARRQENGLDKVKASLIAYRGKGLYIDEVLGR